MKRYFVIYKILPYDVVSKRGYAYAWTPSKSVLKAFIQQRDATKYRVCEIDTDDPPDEFIDGNLNEDNKIIFIKLRSARDLSEYTLFMTTREIQEASSKIEQLFVDECALSKLTSDGEKLFQLVNTVANLDDQYLDALDMIGYKPAEVMYLYDSADDSPQDDYNVFDYISYVDEMCSDRYYRSPRTISYRNMNHHKQAVHTLESFIKVIKDDF